jgi:HAD superfamily hydrolase (TIGR01549 family)
VAEEPDAPGEPAAPGKPDAPILVVDVDGTLVDSNYQHTLAWYRAFRRLDRVVPLWRIHRHIGMGGDKLVAALTDEHTEARSGDDLRAAWKEEFAPMLRDIAALPDARELLVDIRDRGVRLVLASSGAPEHVEHYLDLLAARDIAQAWTTSEDVEATKPAPDLVAVALEKVGGGAAVVVGDATWDCLSAQNLGVPSVAVRTGGFSADELLEAGAREVYDALGHLRADLDRVVSFAAEPTPAPPG